ncbi:MAG: CoA transferase [Pseudorhodoplanes sp.]|jgi:crotonobetainyl-CoA:carnitine CoA-transferase CaiB-like acyl-CoA transferase|nr:CoA transferase [Pseudorhodoplanes sp.]
MVQPLAGLRVLDFTTLLPGPLATLILAEAGAEVIKIERPGGDDMRSFPPFLDGQSAAFGLLNRGKTSLILNLKSAEDRAKLDPLLEAADILVEQFRPGVMQRLGLGYETVKARNPRLIYCSISGYGQGGPRAGEAGHDLNYIGQTGLLSLQDRLHEHPVVPPALIADIAGGSFPAVMNILLALRQRDRTGEGCYLDIAMTDAMFTFAWHALAYGAANGHHPGSGQTMLTGASPRYQLYPTQDGRLVACAALEDHFWKSFAAAIGLSEAFSDDRRDPQKTKAEVARLIAGRTAAEWAPVLQQADCCATIVATLEEAWRDPHFLERGLFARKLAMGSRAILALPVPISAPFRDDPEQAKTAPPAV